MKCNMSRFRFLFFSLLFSFSFILIAPTDTYATRLEVDVNSLSSYGSFSSGSASFSDSSTIKIGNNLSTLSPLVFTLNSTYSSYISCSDSDYVFYNVVYGSGISSFTPSTNYAGNYIYVSGSYNDGIIYKYNSGSSVRRNTIYTSSDVALASGSEFKLTSFVIGCSEEEVAPQTPTPTPTEEPTPTPTEEPTPTPTVSPDSTVNPNDYEYNQMEDTAVRYSFYAFCIICLSAFLIYEIIIKRIILK